MKISFKLSHNNFINKIKPIYRNTVFDLIFESLNEKYNHAEIELDPITLSDSVASIDYNFNNFDDHSPEFDEGEILAFCLHLQQLFLLLVEKLH